MMEKCIVCGGLDFGKILEKDSWCIWHCNDCKLNFVWPQPTDDELKKVYSLKGNYSHSSKGFDKRNLLCCSDDKVDFFLKKGKGKILDVGCASGSFVYIAKNKGLSPVGVDLDSDSIRFGRKEGLDLRHGTLESMKFEDELFDAINLGDIIEHVKNPKLFLAECFRILKRDGMIIVSTPNTNSFFPKATYFLYKLFGVMWSHPTPPYHLFDFSDKNLVSLLKKNNFEIERMNYSKIPLTYSLYHTGYFDNLRKNMNGTSWKDIFGAIKKSISKKIFLQILVTSMYGGVCFIDRIFCRKGDRVVIYARKNK